MARREPWFQLTVECDVTLPPVQGLHFSQTGFLLQIRKFLEDYNGNVREDDREEEFQEELVLPEFVFGSNRHRNYVAHRLREAGWRTDQRGLERILDVVFSDAKLLLEKEKQKKQKKNNSEFGGIPTIILRVKKMVRWEDELEALALELSMQETPKPVPAKKDSVKALRKVKLQPEADGLGASTEECMICMEQLSPGTEVTCMPCSHLFHGDCIEKWLNTSHRCPLCRFPMPASP
ncbi:NEP1-interacting protein-like 1 [Durio zibethinus]|uniref:RING-type E3 ubiquitin transferase n=1 Tax=Durio zibethinus TaxID=66656 RepID=A0A6P5ZR74_DURZI|nr:NEP1-interacting protein-like 1 [Durio zibethinus]